MASSLSEKIKNIRELKNFTQEYMADQLGITQAGYSKIENGATVLTYVKLLEIARVLGVKIEDIINFDSQKYFNSFNNIKGNNNGSIMINSDSDTIKSLYEDKIQLLGKLLEKTEDELKRYREKYGEM
ncbi:MULTISPECIES: helix-turn-helix transcriptional regulator [unclassified Flavobacterium]|uniref:helix-turn-helix transcriptional regulator n=1 Tax=unclassified Flavobacterium TaxID=196869 RepID=UPI00095DE973|nr:MULTISPECIES: helix-turn-helix transcriptional regulator [unclassified Flavobacterium]MBN9283786.1 helix-turn-helix transcriptional regulator [Flavobacterium sp.]OJV68709.1 MAG: transcriptional regulator [Flavobacterium sp. 40-81]